MIKIEKVSVAGFEPAIRGMRNPKNSWDKSDSGCGCNGGGEHLCSNCEFKPQWCGNTTQYIIGPNDKKLAISLAKGGSVHAKYRRQIVVWCDITAPLRWWKEFDTYRFGRERNSCSTMHKIDDHEFTSADFSEEDLEDVEVCAGIVDSNGLTVDLSSIDIHKLNVEALNYWRLEMVKAKKACWKDREEHAFHQLINLLPESYMMKATIMMSYEVLANVYFWRHNHKQAEWREFCKWAETLPYSWIFTIKPTRDESVTYDDVEEWLDKHSKDLTSENRELLIEMLQDTGD